LIYKLNSDGAVFADMAAFRFRLVNWNDKGQVMVALLSKGPTITDSEEAEVLASRKALEFAIEAGFSDLVIAGDSTTVMKAIHSPQCNMSRLGNVYKDIQWLLRGLGHGEINYVRRNANSVAHSLARYARQVDEDIVWL